MSNNFLDLVAENFNYVPNNNGNIIEKVDSANLSYNNFFWKFMKTNQPVIIQSISNRWHCRRDWVDAKSLRVRFDYLKELVGNVKVPVANCSKEYFDSHEKCEMDFFDYLDYWEAKVNGNDNSNASAIESNLYLKDWHLKSQMPDYDFYEVPKYFASDWLNEYLTDRAEDDYKFVYMGPKGSWTPFHADVFSSFSWSTNIVGAKKWIFVLPNEENKLIDALGNLPFDIDEKDLSAKNVKFISITQYENESLFVPSGWYHQVYNVTDTISVNHNWFNGCNISQIWNSLAINLQKVIAEIDDCRQMDNFDEHCQTMLRASFGMNYTEFLNILQHITAKRIQCLNEDNANTNFFDTFTLNKFHIQFDLDAILGIVNIMKTDTNIRTNTIFYDKCNKIEQLIKT